MARYQIELDHNPISRNTFATREAAEEYMAYLRTTIGQREGQDWAVREQPEQIGVSFGTPPTGGK
jgi:hypothetical protein